MKKRQTARSRLLGGRPIKKIVNEQRTLMVREGRGPGVQGGGRLADFSSARGWQKYRQKDEHFRYEIGHKKTHKGKRGIEQPVNPNIDRILIVKKTNKSLLN
jgi:hypothetical protein